MTAVDVDLDIETLWELDSFRVYLTPLRAASIVFPEKLATIAAFQGIPAAQSTWEVPGTAFIDGVKVRVGERVVSLPCEPTPARSGKITIVVPLTDLQ